MKVARLFILLTTLLSTLAMVPLPAEDRLIRVPQDLPDLQAAVDVAQPGDAILIDRGTYRGGVLVPESLHDLTIRGVDRNEVLLDGRDQEENGIYVLGDDVTIENLTAHNFMGNGFYWAGVAGYAGRYLTVYNVGLYGIYAIGSRNGIFEHSLVSGAADAAFYIGECDPCDATLTDLTARLSAVGYSGTNASGNVVVEDSLWELNGTGILPNSYDVGKAEPPQERSVFRNNVVRGSGTVPVPVDTPLAGFWGLGIGIAGGNDNLVERNRVFGSARYGIVIYPTIQEEATWVPQANVVRANTVRGSGTADLALAEGAGPGNCFEVNEHGTAAPVDLGHSGCPRGADVGSDRVAAELAVPPPVAEEQAAGAAPHIPYAPDYSEMELPPPQPTMPRPLKALPEAGYGNGPVAFPVMLVALGLGAVVAGAVAGRRRGKATDSHSDASLASTLIQPRSLMAGGILLILIGMGWSVLGPEEKEPATGPQGADSPEPSSPDEDEPPAQGTNEPGGQIPNIHLPGRFVYHDRRGNLWVTEVRASSPIRITDSGSGFDFDPDWSSDGEQIVFRRDRGLKGETVSSSVILLVRSDGSGLRRLTSEMGSFPAWSPDGRSIAFTGERGIVVVDPEDGSRDSLGVRGECSTWSPDGSVIALCANDLTGVASDNWEVVVIGRGGGAPRRLTDDLARDYPYAWAPDGRTLAFTSERDGANRVWLMNRDGSEQRRLTSFDSRYETVVEWLSEGRLLLAIESPTNGLHGWYLVGSEGTLLGRIPTIPSRICCGEGQLDYWEP